MKSDGCIKERQDYIIYERNGKKTTVRELQLEILTIMDEIDRVCRKNKIDYALHAGSALGIVNYKGFIPWDDDIDVIISRKDYKRFLEALENDLSDKFVYQCFESDTKYNVLIPSIKIRKKNTYIEEVNFLLKNRCKSENGIFVDVCIFGNVSENKLIDQLYRTRVKLLMPIMVLLDNIGINPLHLKKHVLKIAEKYDLKNKKSKLCSQTVAIPWEKFLHEPIFLKEDIYPLKEYEFEGRKFYSYNNIEKVLKEWYGPNCLKKWDGKKWIETYPIEKRKPKHTVNLNLHGSEPIDK